ncbi:MAG: hypothetical protein HA496_01525 [Thaumarchaeota archaeon]|nr:hypothetical protein [Nitrososphaerota archaeon]
MRIQPSQLYISFEKLCHVTKRFNPSDLGSIEPIPIKKLWNDIIFVDGHTRAFPAYVCGVKSLFTGRMKSPTGSLRDMRRMVRGKRGSTGFPTWKTGLCLKRIMRHCGISVVKICSETWRKGDCRGSAKNRLRVLNQQINFSWNRRE